MKNFIRQVLKEYVTLIEQNEKKQAANTKPNPSKVFKGSIWGDTEKAFNNDNIVSGSYDAQGQPRTYDALHSFQSRASDKFGGRMNTLVQNGIKTYKKNNNIKAVDIKEVSVNIDPNTVTVNWEVKLGPSTDGYTYEEFDSRGSAGGGESAVDKQLTSMHSYNTGTPKLVYHYNKDIPVCFNSDGTKKKGGCKGTINIQQKFFKYGKKV